MTELVMKNEVYAVMGAAIEVHRELGPGFLEAVYQEAMELELAARRVPFQRQQVLQMSYKGRPLVKQYVADIVTHGCMIVELKALDILGGGEEAQMINMLKATGMPVGLLINFGSSNKLEWSKYLGPARPRL
jgi:GxxExxY protein